MASRPMANAQPRGASASASSSANAIAPDELAYAIAPDELALMRKYNQIINLIDCPKDLNDSGPNIWGDARSNKRGIIEEKLAIMIAQLFVQHDSNHANAMTRINAVFEAGNQYKIIGDDKPKMNRIISSDRTISEYINDPNNKVEIVRLKHSTGSGGGLSGFFVCQDNGPSDVIVNPIYLLTGGSLLDPATRTTSGENVRYLFPNWKGLKMEKGSPPIKLANADKLPGRYIRMLNMEGCIDIEANDRYPIKITQRDGGWTATIHLTNREENLVGEFNDKMQAQSLQFSGNDTKNRALANMINTARRGVNIIIEGKKYLLAKELGDTLQVLWLKYICDLEAEEKREKEEAERRAGMGEVGEVGEDGDAAAIGEAGDAGMGGGQRGGVEKEEKYDYANTCVATTDIPLQKRAIVNGVGVVHTGKDGTFYYKPRGELTPDQQNYVNKVLKEKLRDEMANHNESVMNAIKDVIILSHNGNWVGGLAWDARKVQSAKNYLQKIIDDLQKANDDFMGILNRYAAEKDVSVKDVKDYTSTRYFVSPFVMKKDGYHSLRCTQPIYYGVSDPQHGPHEGPQHDGKDTVRSITIRPILPNNNYDRLLQEYEAAERAAEARAAMQGEVEELEGGSMKGGSNYAKFIIQCWSYSNSAAVKDKLERAYREYYEQHRPQLNSIERIRARHLSILNDAAPAAAAQNDGHAQANHQMPILELKPKRSSDQISDKDSYTHRVKKNSATAAATTNPDDALSAADNPTKEILAAALAAAEATDADAVIQEPYYTTLDAEDQQAVLSSARETAQPRRIAIFEDRLAEAAAIRAAAAAGRNAIEVVDQPAEAAAAARKIVQMNDAEIARINVEADRLYALFNNERVHVRDEQRPPAQPRDRTRIPWVILEKGENDPLYTRQINQYLRKTMISNTNDTFSLNEQRTIYHTDICYRVLIRRIVDEHINNIYKDAYDTAATGADAAAARAAARAAAAADADADADAAADAAAHVVCHAAGAAAFNQAAGLIDIDALQKQLVDQMKSNSANTSLLLTDLSKIHKNDIKVPFDGIFIFYYVSTYHPEIFTFGTMMSIGLLNDRDGGVRNFEKEANDHFDDQTFYFDDDGVLHINQGQELNNADATTCIAITKICIRYTRYFIQKYPQVATQSLKLFINLYTHRPIDSTLSAFRNETTKPQLLVLNVPSTGGGGDEIDLLPLATDIAMNMYELHYSLRIKAAYSDRKMEDLYEERGMQISFYNEAIQKMEADIKAEKIEPDPYRLALLEYERHILCKQFIELPVIKAKLLEIQQSVKTQIPVKTEQKPVKTQTPSLSKFNRSLKSNQQRKSNQPLSIPSPKMIEGHGGRLKKTRKNRKMKKLKQSYKKTKAALRKSRKH